MTPKRSTSETGVTPGRRFGARDLIIVALILAVIFLIYEQVSAKVDAINATQQAQDMAKPLDELCRDDPNARRQVGEENCDQAASVQAEPPPVAVDRPRDGTNGDDGDPGRGITATAVVNGHLIISYTDGTQEDKGVVVGTDGTPGVPGVDGEPGRGVTSSTITGDGDLVISYTDGTGEVAGRVVGRDGRDGRGVERTAAVDGRLVVTYTDGTSEDVGPLPPGPAGRGVVTIDLDLDRCEFTVHYTSGDPEIKPVTGCEPEPLPPPPSTTTTTSSSSPNALLPLPTR